tara:strand:+ start:1048 stop:1674 length:627 start_codon:yes stop_codon:yes gene_type:complete
METSDINQFVSSYKTRGTMLISPKNKLSPLSKSDLKELDTCCEEVEKEFIQIGDAGEQNNLLVGRFMTDIEKPEVVNNAYSERVLKILNGEKVIKFIREILDLKSDCFVRRAQFNQLSTNNYVGYHLDIDSNPDYIAAAVIQLGSKYEGGKYRVYQKDKSYFDYISSYGDLIISNCNYPHEVTKVTTGERKSLVFFVSKHSGPNKRKR